MAFICNEPTEYKLKEKIFSLSGDSYDIQNAETKEAVFKVKGNVLSIRDSKTMLDKDGNELYKMTEKLLSLRDRMYIEDSRTGETVVTIRKKSLLHVPIIGGRTLQVWNGGNDDGDPWFEIEGNILRKNFVIKDLEKNCEAAVISRKLLNVNTVLDADVYIVRVNPGYDASLMVFISIAVDENFHD